MLVRCLAAALGIRFGRIQFTPDLMPGDVIGSPVFNAGTGEFCFRPGPLFTDTLLPVVLQADDLRRARLIASELLVQSEVLRYAVDLIGATRQDPSIAVGGSPRAGLWLVRAAKAVAALEGRDYVLPELDLGGDLPVEAVDLGPAETVELRRERVPGCRGMRPLGPALLIVLTDFVEGASSAGLEGYLALLARRHCALLVALRDPLLGALDRATPRIEGDELYRRLVLQDLRVERETALARIRRLGVQTLDLDPAQVTAPLLNRYLEIRGAGLL